MVCADCELASGQKRLPDGGGGKLRPFVALSFYIPTVRCHNHVAKKTNYCFLGRVKATYICEKSLTFDSDVVLLLIFIAPDRSTCRKTVKLRRKKILV